MLRPVLCYVLSQNTNDIKKIETKRNETVPKTVNMLLVGKLIVDIVWGIYILAEKINEKSKVLYAHTITITRGRLESLRP